MVEGLLIRLTIFFSLSKIGLMFPTTSDEFYLVGPKCVVYDVQLVANKLGCSMIMLRTRVLRWIRAFPIYGA